jgi:cell division septum initiation protein DivIVA
MDINPQQVRTVEFSTVRKGADPAEIKRFLSDVADELERAQNQATAMEARARAAVARLQEMAEGPPSAPSVDASVEESETISRTLLLAQRTADATIAEARAEAARMVAAANDEAAATLDSTREMSAQMVEEARTESRRVGDTERQAVASEVEALKARRDFLESDVHHLETFLVDQRARIREAATVLIDVTERIPGGLGEVRPPLLSASDDATPDDDHDDHDDVIDDHGDGPSDATDDDPEWDDDETPAELMIVTDIADEPGAHDRPFTDDPTEALPSVEGATVDGSTVPAAPEDDEFRFSFDHERN